MKIIEVKSKARDGGLLYGCLYGEKYHNTCVIITNGNCGNIFEHKFLQVVGETLEKHKISFIYAHNSGAFHRLDTPTKSGQPMGNTYELFDDCLGDLQAYIDWAKANKYKRIILGGHSYGANKVVYYLSKNLNENIQKYILVSPTDMGSLKPSEQKSAEELMPIALKYKAEKRLNELLPIAFDNYNLYTAKAFLDFIENKHAKNLPVYGQGSFNQLKSINQQGLFVMGENDSFAHKNTLNHLQTINNNSKNKNNVVVVVNNCGHTFKNAEQNLAQAILNFVK